MDNYNFNYLMEPLFLGNDIDEKKLLLVITIGLGGNAPSYYLYNYLKDHGNTYDEIVIYAFGTDMYATNDKARTYHLLKGIEGLSSTDSNSPTSPINDVMTNVRTLPMTIGSIHIRRDLPILTKDLSTDNAETDQSYMDLQIEDTTYKYYVGKTFEYYGNREENMKFLNKIEHNILRHILEYFPNTQILIDNNAFIRGSTYTNLNFEHMPWLPQILSSLEIDDRIFLLKKTELPTEYKAGKSQIAEKVPFFSSAAVFRPLPIFTDLYGTLPNDLQVSFQQRTRGMNQNQKQVYSLEIYKCLKNGVVFTELPEPGHVACATSVSASAATEASGGAGTAEVVGGGRKIRKTRKNRSSRNTRRRKRVHSTRSGNLW